MRFAHAGFVAVLALAAATAGAAESDPLPAPAGSDTSRAVQQYNDGVALLLQRRYAQAQGRFEAALKLDDKLAEAHNNLAFSLRMQGRHNFAAALAHYDRAIELKPQLAQAYHYRGLLFLQQGDRAAAGRDLQRLRPLDPQLAGELEAALSGRSPAGDRSGIYGQYE